MAILQTYSDFNQKESYFKVIKIETKKDFDKHYQEITNRKKSIWRGANESKYKIYTSLQRYWIENDLPNDQDELLRYLDQVYEFSLNWNNRFLLRYFRNYGIKEVPFLASLSILRHHGTPTPLLDWTLEPRIGLFFACHYCASNPSDNKIDNFFTLYELTENHPYTKWNIKSYIKGGTKEIFFDEIRAKKTIFKIDDRDDDAIRFMIKNNYNITNQDGLFILNVTPEFPLEEPVIRHATLNSSRDKTATEKINDLRNEFISYDIHKSLKEYTLSKLKEDHIDETYIFPNLNGLATDALKSYLKSNTVE